MSFAFRCKNCGRLETSDNAGESDTPHACVVCGCGVQFDSKTGLKVRQKENWEVLAECDDARLNEIGVSREDIKVHTGTTTKTEGKIEERTTKETLSSEDNV